MSTLVFAQQLKGNDSLIYWSEKRPLSLSDFNITRKTGDTIFIYYSKGSGVHRLGAILTAIDIQVRTEKGKTTFTARAVMNRNRSWIRDWDDTITLKHEQGHFDICEIYTRIMRRELLKATSLARSKIIYEEVLALETAEHALFDLENTFEQGGIQKAWKEKIRNRLAELQPFSNPKVTIATNR